MTTAAIRAATWIFRLTLLALPPRFRGDTGAEMEETFRQLLDDRATRDGVRGVAITLAQTTIDVVRAGLAERRRPTRLVRYGRKRTRREEGGRMKNLIDGWWLDIRHAARSLRRQPAFTVVAVAMLAVGIGGTTSMYTLVHRLMLAPLPGIEAPSEVVALGIDGPDRVFGTFPYPTYRDISELDAFEGVVATSRVNLDLRDAGVAEPMPGQIVSGNFFEVLGVDFAAGRPFTAGETAVVGGTPVAVLSHRSWSSRFGSSSEVIGSQIRLNGALFTVTGVTAPDFVGLSIEQPVPEVWVPLANHEVAMQSDGWDPLSARDDFWLSVAGRLGPGRTPEQARASLEGYMNGLREAAPGVFDEYSIGLTASGAIPHPSAREQMSTILALLVAVVLAVLAIVCSNLANLFLSRSTARRREVGIRVALGSGRARILRQLLLESLVTASLGGAIGLLLSAPMANVILRLYGQSLALNVSPDPRIAVFATLIAIATGLLFGLPSALDALTGRQGPTATGSHRHVPGTLRLRRGLAIAQLALSAVLVVGSTLFARSLGNIAGVDPGFDPAGLTAVSVDLSTHAEGADETRSTYARIREQVSSIPGVLSATYSINTPFGGRLRGGGFWAEGITGPEEDGLFDTAYNVLWPGYFEALATPVVQGRAFADVDDAAAPRVVVVNESFARMLWPGEDPLGKRLSRDSEVGPWMEVIGVVADSKFGRLDEEAAPFFYLSLLQRHEPRAELLVRSEGQSASVARAIRAEVEAAAPGLPALRIRPVDGLIEEGLAQYRLAASITGGFTALALLLAALGMYGLLSYGVSQRTREIGIRMALGARTEEVTSMVTRQTAFLTAVGLVVGLLLAAGVTRSLTTLLYEVDPLDPLAYLVATGALVVASLAAAWIPARRASRVDPAEALRYD